MKRTTLAALALLAITTLAGCAGTKLTNSWKDPSAGPIDFEKVLVVFMHESPGVRRTMEDEIVDATHPTAAVASHEELGNIKEEDVDQAKEKLTRDGFDGAIVMRVIGKDQQQSYSPGMVYPTPYLSFWGYYGYGGYGWAYQPGMMITDTFVLVETNVYSLAEDKLIWSGVSETMNPNDATKMLHQVLRTVSGELKRQGL